MSLLNTLMARLAFLDVASTALGACGGERVSLPPAPVDPASLEDSGEASTGIGRGVVDLALASIGSPYKWGGTDANGFDCSGLIQFAYGEFGIDLPRVSRDQIRAGSPITFGADPLMPGDILGFWQSSPGRVSHVGLYVGKGEFIHSSSTGVRVSNLGTPYWQEHLVAARRIVE